VFGGIVCEVEPMQMRKVCKEKRCAKAIRSALFSCA
jgi:hypothetical protein